MLPAFATIADLEARLDETFSEAEQVRAQAALDDASALIRAEANKTWVTEGELDDDLHAVLLAITVAVVRRVLENPNGVKSQSLGDATITYTNASGDVYLTAAERRLVRKAAGLSGVLGSVDLEIGTPGWSGDVIYVQGQTEPLPFTYEPLRR